MDSITTIHCTLLFALMLVGHSVMSQQREPILADWCIYCRKMDKETFQDEHLATL